MKIAEYLETVPLTALEKDHLKQMYRHRFKVFCGGYSLLVGVLLYKLLPFLSYDDAMLSRRAGKGVDYDIFGHTLTIGELFYFLLALFGGGILISGAFIFFKKLFPLLKDIKQGKKEAIIYTITNKLSFAQTDEYFLSFNDPKYLHYKVEEEIYHQCKIGDNIAIYRAPFSKHVFEKDFRFTLM